MTCNTLSHIWIDPVSLLRIAQLLKNASSTVIALPTYNISVDSIIGLQFFSLKKIFVALEAVFLVNLILFTSWFIPWALNYFTRLSCVSILLFCLCIFRERVVFKVQKCLVSCPS